MSSRESDGGRESERFLTCSTEKIVFPRTLHSCWGSRRSNSLKSGKPRIFRHSGARLKKSCEKSFLISNGSVICSAMASVQYMLLASAVVIMMMVQGGEKSDREKSRHGEKK